MERDDFDLPRFLPYLLNRAAEECGAGFQRTYKARHGMVRGEWRVLFHLGQLGRTHKTRISRAAQKLAQRRFLRRIRPCSGAGYRPVAAWA